MNEEQSNTKAFHVRFGILINDRPTIVDVDTAKLRHDLILEEFNELIKAMLAEDLVAIADALGDLKYVVDGTAVSYGIDLEEVCREIHRSNMSKGDPEVVRAPNGKILKSRNFTPPNLAPILWKQMKQ